MGALRGAGRLYRICADFHRHSGPVSAERGWFRGFIFACPDDGQPGTSFRPRGGSLLNSHFTSRGRAGCGSAIPEGDSCALCEHSNPRALVDQTGNRARRDTTHPQAAAPPSPHSLRASSPAGGREGSLHSETTSYAALASTSEGPPGSKEPRPGEYVGSKAGHTRSTRGRTSEDRACAAWRASTAPWPDA